MTPIVCKYTRVAASCEANMGTLAESWVTSSGLLTAGWPLLVRESRKAWAVRESHR